MSIKVIAIDGPAASGKSTIASHLARLLSIPYVNTGSMFRAVAWFIIKSDVDVNDELAVCELLNSIDLDYRLDDEKNYSLFLNGQKLDSELRTADVVAIVSKVATIKSVREMLKDFQRKIANNQMVVMEGRDIGSVIFPDAKWKFFVTASPMIRAKRRLEQEGQIYSQASLELVAQSIADRDRIDSNRAIAPLKRCSDATLVDTSDMNVEETITYIQSFINEG